MFFNEDLISPRQMSTVKDEMERPSYDYQCDQDNAWAFYNHVTHSYKNVHPRSWLSDTKNFSIVTGKHMMVFPSHLLQYSFV